MTATTQTFVLAATNAENQQVYYTGRAGPEWVSTNYPDVFRMSASEAAHKVRLFNGRTALTGLTFNAEPHEPLYQGEARVVVITSDGQTETMEFIQTIREGNEGNDRYLIHANDFIRGKSLSHSVRLITLMVRDRETGEYKIDRTIVETGKGACWRASY